MSNVPAAAAFVSLTLAVCFWPQTVFLSAYLDFISMMPIEPPGNN